MARRSETINLEGEKSEERKRERNSNYRSFTVDAWDGRDSHSRADPVDYEPYDRNRAAGVFTSSEEEKSRRKRDYPQARSDVGIQEFRISPAGKWTDRSHVAGHSLQECHAGRNCRYAGGDKGGGGSADFRKAGKYPDLWDTANFRDECAPRGNGANARHSLPRDFSAMGGFIRCDLSEAAAQRKCRREPSCRRWRNCRSRDRKSVV